MNDDISECEDAYELESFDTGIIAVLVDYDRSQRAYIKKLEAKNKKLTKENADYLNQALASAQASSASLLKNILNGTFDNIRPTDSKEQMLSRIAQILLDYEKSNPDMILTLRMEVKNRNHNEGSNYSWDSTTLKLGTSA